jgi:hypothetical protein
LPQDNVITEIDNALLSYEKTIAVASNEGVDVATKEVSGGRFLVPFFSAENHFPQNFQEENNREIARKIDCPRQKGTNNLPSENNWTIFSFLELFSA